MKNIKLVRVGKCVSDSNFYYQLSHIQDKYQPIREQVFPEHMSGFLKVRTFNYLGHDGQEDGEREEREVDN